MNHNFDIDLAKEYGVDISIVINNLAFWIQKNKANNKHIHEGRVWTYNSTKAFSEIFPYWTESQMRRILLNMEEKGIIETGNYNQSQYDRTKWYTFTDAFVKNHDSICEFCQMDLGETTNGFGQTNEPIPDNKPFSKTTDSKPYIIIIDYLNEKAGTKFKVIQSVRGQIDERFKEGFTLDDFKTVIDKKVADWKGTEYEKYLRPSTLFRPSKFDAYLNEKPSEKKHAGSKEAYSVDMSGYDTL